MQATIGVWSPTVLGVKLHSVPASPLVGTLFNVAMVTVVSIVLDNME